VVKQAAALVLVVAAVGSAVYLGSLHLGQPRAKLACPSLVACFQLPTRASWQLPVAVVIAALGVAGAVGVLKRAKAG
jgi:hypothetical protein